MKFEQREIKVRAWEPYNERFLYKFITNIGWCTDVECKHSASIWDRHELLITEWTGLTDKSGVDIYEGDVIKCEDNPEKCDYSLVGIVTMFNGEWCINEDLPFSMYGEFSIEIVGNAFENPELLEVRK